MGILPPPTALPVTLPVLPRASGLTVPPSPAALLGPPVSVAALPPAAPQVIRTVQPGAAPAVMQGGLSMGESRAPLPGKLVQKIRDLRYVEMSELLPESWLLVQHHHFSSFAVVRGRHSPAVGSVLCHFDQCVGYAVPAEGP